MACIVDFYRFLNIFLVFPLHVKLEPGINAPARDPRTNGAIANCRFKNSSCGWWVVISLISRIRMFVRSRGDKKYKKKMQENLKIVSRIIMQTIFQFFFKETIRIDLVWEIVWKVCNLVPRALRLGVREPWSGPPTSV